MRKIQSNVICDTRGFALVQIARTSPGAPLALERGHKAIQLNSAMFGGDDPLIGDIHVSSAESAECRPTKRHKSIRGHESHRRQGRPTGLQGGFDEVRT